jgi:hypothetical protein
LSDTVSILGRAGVDEVRVIICLTDDRDHDALVYGEALM